MKTWVDWYLDHEHTVKKWFWLAMVPVTILWLKNSVLWVAIMSLYANYETSAAAEEARRAQGNDGESS